ncbi:ABC transporter permease [Chelativorans alearense]|uniref:ABC transporter permease n=1 Tax=Chelativorans alearense TaxID=2681495 RepID=UPI0013D45F13|nr:ABC transporter permease [Chelativorans alearense]
MAHAESDTADLGKASAPGGRMNFWGALLQNGAYQTLSNTLFKTQRRQFVMLASLPLLWIVFANLGPIVEMFWIGFLDSYPPKVGYEPKLTFANWAAFFQDRVFIVPFFRTLAFSLIFTVITLLITYPVAYFLAKHVKRKNQLLFLLLLLIPFWVGEIVRTYAIMILLGNNGAVNLVLKSLGLIDRPIPFMYTGFSLGVGIIYLTALYMLLPLYSALEKIPDNYLEAAADLGAGAWTRFRRITLPLSKEGIASGCTLVFLISTGYYATPVLLGGPRSTVFAETIAGFFHVAGDQWPMGAAFSSIMLIATLAATGIFLKLMGRGGKGMIR